MRHEPSWIEDRNDSRSSGSVIVLRCTQCGKKITGGRSSYEEGRWYPPASPHD